MSALRPYRERRFGLGERSDAHTADVGLAAIHVVVPGPHMQEDAHRRAWRGAGQRIGRLAIREPSYLSSNTGYAQVQRLGDVERRIGVRRAGSGDAAAEIHAVLVGNDGERVTAA